MTEQDIRKLYNYLALASQTAQKYPELDLVWGQIEDTITLLDQQLESDYECQK